VGNGYGRLRVRRPRVESPQSLRDNPHVATGEKTRRKTNLYMFQMVVNSAFRGIEFAFHTISGCAACYRSVSLPQPEGLRDSHPQKTLRRPFLSRKSDGESVCRGSATAGIHAPRQGGAPGTVSRPVKCAPVAVGPETCQEPPRTLRDGGERPRRARHSSRVSPSTRTSFLRPSPPARIPTLLRGTSRDFARSRTSASFARFSTGGAVRRTRTASPERPATSSRDALGSTCTARTAPPRSRPSPLVRLTESASPGRRGSAPGNTSGTGSPGSPPSGRNRCSPP